MSKRRGRPTRLNGELIRQICGLLNEGHSITATCDALGVTESKYFEWMKKGEQDEQPYARFREQATRARANGKIALVRQILGDKDWRAKAWYLERCWPNEFGRSVDRPLPKEPEPERQGPLVSLILSMPDGTQRETTFEEAEKIFCNFPRKDTYEPPAKEGKSSPVPDDDVF